MVNFKSLKQNSIQFQDVKLNLEISNTHESISNYVSNQNKITVSEIVNPDFNIVVQKKGNELSNYLDEMTFSIRSELLSSASSSGRIHKSSNGDYTSTLGNLRIQNESSTGCSYGWRSWMKFDVTSIPDLSEINDIDYYL